MEKSTANSSLIPRRSSATHSEILDDEVSVYEWTRREVHALNPTAARVWQMCDGRTSVGEMADALRAELDVAHADELVWLALAEFQEKGLIERDLPLPDRQATFSRRAVIARLGIAAMLPIVTSVIAPTALQAQSLQSQTFSFTGAVQTFTVPAGVTSLMIDAFGAKAGGLGIILGVTNGGEGGRVQATIAVTPGESLSVYVGGSGDNVNFSGAGTGGFNGGGNGGTASVAPFLCGGGGGGASDVRRGGTKLVVAGGGGGGTAHMVGGDGGGTTGAAGQDGGVVSTPNAKGGGGGTQTAGGAGGAGAAGASAGASGSAGTGGTGASAASGAAGGGGGGYFGGGGGGGHNDVATPESGGGGGGSSYTDPAATNVIHTQGERPGFGEVIISW